MKYAVKKLISREIQEKYAAVGEAVRSSFHKHRLLMLIVGATVVAHEPMSNRYVGLTLRKDLCQ